MNISVYILCIHVSAFSSLACIAWFCLGQFLPMYICEIAFVHHGYYIDSHLIVIEIASFDDLYLGPSYLILIDSVSFG